MSAVTKHEFTVVNGEIDEVARCQMCDEPVSTGATTCSDAHRKALQRARERFADWPDDLVGLAQWVNPSTGRTGTVADVVSDERLQFSGRAGGMGIAVIKRGLDENHFTTSTTEAVLALNPTCFAVAVGRDVVLVGGIPKSGAALDRGYGTRMVAGAEHEIEGRILQRGSEERGAIQWPPDPVGLAVRRGLIDPDALDSSDAGPALRAAQQGDHLGVLEAALDSLASTLDSALEPRDLVAVTKEIPNLISVIEGYVERDKKTAAQDEETPDEPRSKLALIKGAMMEA